MPWRRQKNVNLGNSDHTLCDLRFIAESHRRSGASDPVLTTVAYLPWCPFSWRRASRRTAVPFAVKCLVAVQCNPGPVCGDRESSGGGAGNLQQSISTATCCN